jgi:hypothetical protein
MEMPLKALVLFGLVAGTALEAGAQVGYQPDRSPYRDREYDRDWTFFAGHFSAERDPVGVAPTDGVFAGFRWQMHLAGPLYLGTRLAGASVDRTIIDPTKLIVERVVGHEKVPMVFGDVGLEMSLTGHKTWHGFSPFVNAGGGIVADIRGANDVGNYRFGAPFSITMGTGLTWSPGGSWQFRAEWSNYMYRIGYPSSYFVKTTADPPVLPATARRSFWRRNPALIFGLSFIRPK